MALSESVDEGRGKILELLSLSKEESLEIVILLAAQLAGIPAVGRQSGACPTFTVVDGESRRLRRVTLCVDKER